MGLLNKIYGLVKAGRCLFNIFCADKFKQSGADRRVFREFDDVEVEMVMFIHVDDGLFTPKRRRRGSPLSLKKRL